MPEKVSLLQYCDADKERIFESGNKSLIQTMGRAARHINGKAILYAKIAITVLVQRAWMRPIADEQSKVCL